MFLHILLSFPFSLDYTDANPSHPGKAFQVERENKYKHARWCLVCLSNNKDVYVGGMEGVRGRFIGDENRDVTGQIDITRYVSACSSLQQFWLLLNADFRAGKTRNYEKLKLKRQRGQNSITEAP